MRLARELDDWIQRTADPFPRTHDHGPVRTSTDSGSDQVASPGLPSPLFQLLAHLRALTGLRCVIGHVTYLLAVFFQVEELFVVEFGPVHVLPVAADDPLRCGNAIP
jgi:hypothetical protein